MKRHAVQDKKRVANRIWASICAIALAAACDSRLEKKSPDIPEIGIPSNARVLPIDAGRAQIVNSANPRWTRGDGWRIVEPAVHHFGGDVDAGGVSIGRLITAIRLNNGHLVIADRRTNELYWINLADGSSTSVGGTGMGPGEFQGLDMVDAAAADTVIAADAVLRRVTVISPTGTVIRTDPLEAGVWRGAWTRDDHRSLHPTLRAALDDHTIVGITHTKFSGLPIGVAQDSVWFLLDPPGTGPVEIFGPMQGSEYWSSPGIRALPFGRWLSFAEHGSHFYVTTGKPAEISVYTRDGKLDRLIRIDRPLRAVDQVQIDSAKKRMLRAQYRPREGEAERLNRIQYPKDAPAFINILVDAQANIWAEQHRAPSGLPVYEVFDQHGIWLGQVTAPRGTRLLQIGHDYVLATRRNDLDVDEVLIYTLVR